MQGTWLEVELSHADLSDYEVTHAEYQGCINEPEWLVLDVLSSVSLLELMGLAHQLIAVTITGTDQVWDFSLWLEGVELLSATELVGRNVYRFRLVSPVHVLSPGNVTQVLKGLSLGEE